MIVRDINCFECSRSIFSPKVPESERRGLLPPEWDDWSKTERGEWIERHRDQILAEIEVTTISQTAIKWGLLDTTLRHRVKRWASGF